MEDDLAVAIAQAVMTTFGESTGCPLEYDDLPMVERAFGKAMDILKVGTRYDRALPSAVEAMHPALEAAYRTLDGA